MSTELPGPAPGPADPGVPAVTASGRHARVEAEHVDVGQASIDVSHAEIVRRPVPAAILWSVGVLFVFVIAVGAASLLFTSSQVHPVKSAQAAASHNALVLRQQVLADCGFYRDLAGLPVAVMAGTGHPSELGVKIVLDSRASFYGHDCPGTIPPLSRSVRDGAAFYHLAIPQPPARPGSHG